MISSNIKKYDVVIIGSGIIGSSVAYKLSLSGIYKIAVIDKETAPNKHQTGRNSGVIHSGVYYPKGSLKSDNCINGYRQMLDFLRTYDIPYKITGKLIAAVDESEIPELRRLYENAVSVGLNVNYLDDGEIKKIDQNLVSKTGFFVEETGLTDYSKVLNKLIELSTRNGVDYLFDQHISSVINGESSHITTNRLQLSSKYIINCAGLQSDRVYEICTKTKSPLKIIPFKGEYFKVENSLYSSDIPVYPVPNPNFPFLGVHLTRMLDGTLKVGPNAVLSLDREGYNGFNININDSIDIFTDRTIYNILFRYSRFALTELLKHNNKNYFEKKVNNYWSAFNKEAITGYTCGIRAQATENGNIISDFKIVKLQNQIHVLNAPSPAATSCLAIADTIIKELKH